MKALSLVQLGRLVIALNAARLREAARFKDEEEILAAHLDLLFGGAKPADVFRFLDIVRSLRPKSPMGVESDKDEEDEN